MKSEVRKMLENPEVWSSLKSSSFFLFLADEIMRLECTEENTPKGRCLSPDKNIERCSKPWGIESFGTVLDMECSEFCCVYILASMAPSWRDRQAPAGWRRTRNCKTWTQAGAADEELMMMWSIDAAIFPYQLPWILTHWISLVAPHVALSSGGLLTENRNSPSQTALRKSFSRRLNGSSIYALTKLPA